MDSLNQCPPVLFAREKLKEACGELGIPCRYTLARDEKLQPDEYGFSLREGAPYIRAGGEEAAMNALLDLKDSLEAFGAYRLEEGLHRPRVKHRGIKLNVPLDARSPSYSDCGDSAQENIPVMWDESFWQGLLDRMALNRYNTLTMWNLCPFPSMVRVPEYENAALDDVMVSSAMAGGTSRGLGFYTQEMRENLVCVRKMTMDEKMAFWDRVFRMALDRCIKVYLFTWNLYLYGLEDSGYTLSERAEDENTKDYIRASVAALLRRYPALSGIGVTAGENLCSEWTENQDLCWVRDTYGRGMEQVLKEQPGREITLICRTHMTTLSQLEKAFQGFTGNLEISSKYAMAHMTAAERPRFSDELVQKKPEGLGLWLTLRQDDFYMFPWADDEFLETFMENLPQRDLCGYYFGSDGVIWGLESQSRLRENQRRYFVDKHFFSFALMGRLGYKKGLSREEKEAILKKAAPGLPPGALLEKLRHASAAVRLVSLVHWRHYDLQWYPEACCRLNEEDHLTVFDDLNAFIRCGACPATGTASVLETAQGCPDGKTSALFIADRMLREAALADGISLPEGKSGAERELCADLGRAVHLARYYAYKICGAVYWARGRTGKAEDDIARARDFLQRAKESWLRYSDETARWYKPRRLSRLRGVVSPDMWDERVERDCAICEDGRY